MNSVSKDTIKEDIVKKIVIVGLVRGRHEMPVDSYIFDEDVNPMDFNEIDARVVSWINQISEYTTSENDFMFPHYPVGEGVEVVLYVTGLSSALSAVIRWCAKCHISLMLMHFDRDSGEYKPQLIF